MDTPEQLATDLTLAEIEFRLRVLDEVIRYDQARGGEAWKHTAVPQADILNAARALILKGQPPIVIQASVGTARGKG